MDQDRIDGAVKQAKGVLYSAVNSLIMITSLGLLGVFLIVFADLHALNRI